MKFAASPRARLAAIRTPVRMFGRCAVFMPALLFSNLWANQAQTSPTPEAVSREVSVLTLIDPTLKAEALSREVSVLTLIDPSLKPDAFSREVSILTFGRSASAPEAVSREFSALTLGLPALSIVPSSTPGLGEKVVFTVVANWPGPVEYQWRFNGQNIPGATGSTYTIDKMEILHCGSYSCVAVDAFGGASSLPLDVQVPLPQITLVDNFVDRGLFSDVAFQGSGNNINATIEAGEPSHAGRRGAHSVWMAWRAPESGIATFSTVGSGFDTVLAVYTGTTLTGLVPVASDDDSGGYFTSEAKFNAVRGTDYQIAIDGVGNANGRIVVSWLLEAGNDQIPVITTHPQSHVVGAGGSVSLQVAVQSAKPVSYQWFFNGNPIPGATSDILALDSISQAQAGSYRVLVTSSIGRAVLSEPALIEISDAADAGLSEDKFANLFGRRGFGALKSRGVGAGFPSISAGIGGSQNMNNFGATTELGEPVLENVQTGASIWYELTALESGTFLIDTVGSDIDTILGVYTGDDLFTLKEIATDHNNPPGRLRSRVQFYTAANVAYKIVVAGANSAQGNIKLNWILGDPPGIVTPPASQAIPVRGTATLGVVATGKPSPTYQWFFNGSLLRGETQPALKLENLQATQYGTYRIEVRNPFATVSAGAAVYPPFGFDPRNPPQVVNGAFQFQIVTVEAGKLIVIEASTDLANWLPIAAKDAGSFNSFSIPLDGRSRFYRAVAK